MYSLPSIISHKISFGQVKMSEDSERGGCTNKRG